MFGLSLVGVQADSSSKQAVTTDKIVWLEPKSVFVSVGAVIPEVGAEVIEEAPAVRTASSRE